MSSSSDTEDSMSASGGCHPMEAMYSRQFNAAQGVGAARQPGNDTDGDLGQEGARHGAWQQRNDSSDSGSDGDDAPMPASRQQANPRKRKALALWASDPPAPYSPTRPAVQSIAAPTPSSAAALSAGAATPAAAVTPATTLRANLLRGVTFVDGDDQEPSTSAAAAAGTAGGVASAPERRRGRPTARYFDDSATIELTIIRCYKCGQAGHVSRECSNAAKIKPCHLCAHFGHDGGSCPNRECTADCSAAYCIWARAFWRVGCSMYSRHTA